MKTSKGERATVGGRTIPGIPGMIIIGIGLLLGCSTQQASAPEPTPEQNEYENIVYMRASSELAPSSQLFLTYDPESRVFDTFPMPITNVQQFSVSADRSVLYLHDGLATYRFEAASGQASQFADKPYIVVESSTGRYLAFDGAYELFVIDQENADTVIYLDGDVYGRPRFDTADETFYCVRNQGSTTIPSAVLQMELAQPDSVKLTEFQTFSFRQFEVSADESTWMIHWAGTISILDAATGLPRASYAMTGGKKSPGSVARSKDGGKFYYCEELPVVFTEDYHEPNPEYNVIMLPSGTPRTAVSTADLYVLTPGYPFADSVVVHPFGLQVTPSGKFLLSRALVRGGIMQYETANDSLVAYHRFELTGPYVEEIR